MEGGGNRQQHGALHALDDGRDGRAIVFELLGAIGDVDAGAPRRLGLLQLGRQQRRGRDAESSRTPLSAAVLKPSQATLAKHNA